MVSNSIFRELLSCDNLDPIEKFKYLSSQSSIQSSEMVLLALYAVDSVLNSFSNSKRAFYLLDDKSVIEVMTSISTISRYTDDIISNALVILDVSKLIYRFPCARKFLIWNTEIKQFRINSWGKEYLNTKGTISQYQKEDSYCYLFELLDKPITTESAKEIMKENHHLPVKLLS